MLDLTYLEARTLVLPYQYKKLKFVLVGCGGTGGWVAPHVCRLAKIIADQTTLTTSVKFIDPDIVETINLTRQNFCPAEVGLFKAKALAIRYGAAYGISVSAVTEFFNLSQITSVYDELVILIGCVDNHLARITLNKGLARNGNYGAGFVWLDSGNSRTSGQVLIGTTTDTLLLDKIFPNNSWCTALPSPALQHPELLEPEPGKTEDNGVSCEELALRAAQSLTINQMMSSVLTGYLVKLVTGKLKTFQTYLSLHTTSMQSSYITPQTLAPFCLNTKPN